MGIALLAIITSGTGRADDGGTSATIASPISVRNDPLFERSFLELPVPPPDPIEVKPGDEPAGPNPRQRLLAHRLRTELDERRIEQLWRLRSTNETILDFSVGYRLPGTAVTWEVFNPLWYWGPESTWWIVHGPGTVERGDGPFPEFGRHHPAAFFRPPGTLPIELLERSRLGEPGESRSDPERSGSQITESRPVFTPPGEEAARRELPGAVSQKRARPEKP